MPRFLTGRPARSTNPAALGPHDLDVVRVESDGGLARLTLEHEIPNLDAMLLRMRDLRPVWERIKALGWLKRADAYERDDRFRGGVGRPDRDGKRRNWGPGYLRYQRTGLGKRFLKINSRRPYHPIPTDATNRRIIDATLEWIVNSGLP